MIGGGLGVPRHHAWRGTHFHAGLQGVTWPLHPATMHGGVQCNCPAMHGGGANRVKFKICFKFRLKICRVRLRKGQNEPDIPCMQYAARSRKGVHRKMTFLDSNWRPAPRRPCPDAHGYSPFLRLTLMLLENCAPTSCLCPDCPRPLHFLLVPPALDSHACHAGTACVPAVIALRFPCPLPSSAPSLRSHEHARRPSSCSRRLWQGGSYCNMCKRNIQIKCLQRTYETAEIFCNMRLKYLQNTWKLVKKTIANICNIQIKHLQHTCKIYITFR
jgi:hypothetical protein